VEAFSPRQLSQPCSVAFVLDNNTIVGEAGALCDLELKGFVADCGGDSPEFVCPCCTECCQDGEDCTDEIVLDYLKASYKRHYEHDNIIQEDSESLPMSLTELGG